MPRKTARNFIMRLTSDSWGLRKYSILGTGGEIVGVLRVETRDAQFWKLVGRDRRRLPHRRSVGR
jgi:hypothetical protein